MWPYTCRPMAGHVYSVALRRGVTFIHGCRKRSQEIGVDSKESLYSNARHDTWLMTALMAQGKDLRRVTVAAKSSIHSQQCLVRRV